MVAVLSSTGIRLMPTSNYKARKLLASGRAVKERYNPVFTIRLLNRSEGVTQPIEYDSDTGSIHVGISIKSQKHEYVSERRDLLADETERHDIRRKYRRQRRSRLRYRKPRFDNRRASKKEDWLPPGIQNRMNQQVRLFEQYAEVIPITQATFEMGSFDTQLLQAIESGKPIPRGTDYQQGPRYRTETLRQAVFLRDGYQCCFCGRGLKDHAKLHVHHLGFRKGDHTDRMSNLATACENCHTPKNHKPGGILYDAKPKMKPFKGAAFMTAVRWNMWNLLKTSRTDVEFHITYGARTKLVRQKLHIKKRTQTMRMPSEASIQSTGYKRFICRNAAGTTGAWRSSMMQNTSTAGQAKKPADRNCFPEGQNETGTSPERTCTAAEKGRFLPGSG